MTDAQPALTKGQMLKDTLELLFHAPDQFEQSLLCHPKTLNRLLRERYESLVGEALQPSDLAVEGLKRLTLRLFVEAIQQDDVHLAEGLVLIWHQYLEPIHSGSARSIPPVARVLAYCAQSGNLKEFWRELENFARDSRMQLPGQVTGLFQDVSVNGHQPGHTAQQQIAAQKQRRTYVNYIQRALDELAKADALVGLFEEVVAPSLDEVTVATHTAPANEARPEAAADEATNPHALDALVVQILEECGQLPPACGQVVPTSHSIERTVEMQSVKGEPISLDYTPAGASELGRMSGVLVGVPGSGRTSFLYRVACTWAKEWSYGHPLAIYLSARDFLIYARNRRSVYEFIARWTLPQSSRDEIEILRKRLEAYEHDHGLLWLVDDLDRLAEADQAEVVMQLALSPAMLYATVPWEADQIVRLMEQPHVAVFHLVDLSKIEQHQMLVGLIADQPTIDVRLARLTLWGMPYLSTLPLGVMAVYRQLLVGASERTQVVACVLDEWFVRAGLPRPRFSGEWFALGPVARSLLIMATVAGADILWYRDEGIFTPRARFEQGAGWTPDCCWELLSRTRMFELHPQRAETFRFFNWDILGYLIANSEAARLFAHTQVELTNSMTPMMKLVIHAQNYIDCTCSWRHSGIETGI